jgi:hypothetical protein
LTSVGAENFEEEESAKWLSQPKNRNQVKWIWLGDFHESAVVGK